MTDQLQRGYEAASKGLSLGPRPHHDFRSGWQAFHDREWWNKIAALVGAELRAFSYRDTASFIYPDGTTQTIGMHLAKALCKLLPKE